MRALRIHSPPDTSQPCEGDVLRHWTERRRELLVSERLDKLVTVLERLAVVLERRTV